MSLRTLSWMLLLVAALAAAVWWGRDHPRLRAWGAGAMPPALSPAQTAPGAPIGALKCRGANGLLYTDGVCPPGTREETLQGALSVLPAVRPAAPADAAASAQTPLRRLAGPDDSAAQRERVLEQALGR